LATLATSTAPKTVDRIIDSFPAGEQGQVRAMLSESLKAVVTQRLIPSAESKGRVLAVEILIGTLPMANLIRDDKVFQIPSMMQMGKGSGMKIMDESILALLQEGRISAQDAYQNANDKNRFRPLLERDKQAPPPQAKAPQSQLPTT